MTNFPLFQIFCFDIFLSRIFCSKVQVSYILILREFVHFKVIHGKDSSHQGLFLIFCWYLNGVVSLKFASEFMVKPQIIEYKKPDMQVHSIFRPTNIVQAYFIIGQNWLGLKIIKTDGRRDRPILRNIGEFILSLAFSFRLFARISRKVSR